MTQTPSEKQQKLKKLRNLYRSLKNKPEKLRTLLRVKALIAYYKGHACEVVADCYEVSPKTLRGWIKAFEADEPLDDAPRSGRPPKLPSNKAEELKALITSQNQRVWTARHVFRLIATTFGVLYSVKYIPELLRGLGLSYQKAVHTLIRRNHEARQQWLYETLPGLYADKLQEGWRIFFQDEVGFQTEGTLSYSWGSKGEKIEIDNYGRHGRVNMLGAFELGSAQFYGLLTPFKVNACRFRRFLCHLHRELRGDKLVLICDNASFHKAKWLSAWVKGQTWLRLAFLPSYSPDFNPIERLWRWLKSEYVHNRCWASQAALKADLQQMLLELPKRSDDIKGLMRQELERLEEMVAGYETARPLAA